MEMQLQYRQKNPDCQWFVREKSRD